jgi:collagenase-like PrtC family protease
VNGSLVELLDDVKYLLSPQDLMAIDFVPELVVAGVSISSSLFLFDWV